MLVMARISRGDGHFLFDFQSCSPPFSRVETNLLFPRVNYVPDITNLFHAMGPVIEDRDDYVVPERRTFDLKAPRGTTRLGYNDHTMMILLSTIINVIVRCHYPSSDDVGLLPGHHDWGGTRRGLGIPPMLLCFMLISANRFLRSVVVLICLSMCHITAVQELRDESANQCCYVGLL